MVERKAIASARRRSNQTAFNLVLALVASLGAVALVVLVVVRPGSVERPLIDYAAIAADAQSTAAVPLVVPDLPNEWTANRAEFLAGATDAIDSWQIGFLTPGQQYIGFVQGIDVDTRWMSDQTANADVTGRVTIGDLLWLIYDRRDVRDPGNLAYVLTTVSGESTIVLGGTAADEEFEVLATAVTAQLAQEATP